MSKLDKDQVLAAFTEAYKNVNGKEPTIEAKSGWYSIDGGKNVRLAAIEEMTAVLTGGAAPAPAQAEKAPAKKATKTAKAVAAKVEKTLGFSVVKTGEGLAPANYWLNYLANLGSDSRAPHGFY